MTGPQIEVRGADQLADVARRLKEAGDGELRKELLRGIRNEAKPLVKAVKDSVDEYLPNSGGAADAVRRSSFGVRSRLSGKNAGVRIVGTGRQVRALRRIDAGILRHPVFGNQQAWVAQRIRPGFFSEPMEAGKGPVQQGLVRVISDIAARVERAV